MPYAFWGEGRRWIKTCRTEDGFHLRVCEPSWEVLSPWLVTVPGAWVVSVRCDLCDRYFNPREMAMFSPGGRYNAYLGTCGAVSNAIQRTGEPVAEQDERNTVSATSDTSSHPASGGGADVPSTISERHHPTENHPACETAPPVPPPYEGSASSKDGGGSIAPGSSSVVKGT